jgi:hypothetical protein
MRFKGTALLWLLLMVFGVAAQELQPESDTESWNDISLAVPLSKAVDFNAVLTARFGKNISRVHDARILMGITWKLHPSFSVQPSYTAIRARNALSLFRTEHRLSLRATYRFPIKQFGLSHRSIIERRIRQPLNSWRYRPSVTIEKELPKSFLAKSKIYFTEEVFYDSLPDRFSRNRASIGFSRVISKKLTLDIYYLRQNDGITRPGDLHVIGTNWRIRP